MSRRPCIPIPPERAPVRCRFPEIGIAWTILIANLLVVTASHAGTDDPWADAVIEYEATNPVTGYTTAAVALGAPRGLGPSVPLNDFEGATNVVSLGVPAAMNRGRLVLRFDTAVTDDPLNPLGLDCIVYSNAFWGGGLDQRRFQEPAIIEISDDGATWYLIPGSREFPYAGGALPLVTEAAGDTNLLGGQAFFLAGLITNPNDLDVGGGPDTEEYNWGYGDMSPTLAPYLDNYLRPDDPFTVGMTARAGGGDAFDIAWAIAQDGSPPPLTQFRYIRLSPFVSRTMSVGTASPEIMAAADVAPNVDTDGDGILDEWELRVSLTDPNRPESTVLALEIPDIEGGSPSGTLLGMTSDARGNQLRLYSSGDRTSTTHSAIVDLLRPTAPGGSLPIGGYTKSAAVLQFVSSVANFTAEEIQAAEVVLHYLPSQVAGLNEAALTPFRHTGAAYSQAGITNVVVDSAANSVTFQSVNAGTFVLGAPAGSGDAGAATVYVAFGHEGAQSGTPAEPYATLAEGVAGTSAGGTIRIASGATDETIVVAKAVHLETQGGLVRIGDSAARGTRDSDPRSGRGVGKDDNPLLLAGGTPGSGGGGRGPAGRRDRGDGNSDGTDRGSPPPVPLGIEWLAPILAIAGALALRPRRKAGRARGFSMIELLISIAIVSLLAALLLPALSRARQKARSVECVSNLKQLYLANTMFAAEHDGHYVPAAPDINETGGGLTRWHGARKTIDDDFDPKSGPLAEYLPDARVKECPVFFEFRERGDVPNAFESGTGGYGYNMPYIGGTSYADEFPDDLRAGTLDSRVRMPSQTIMFADAALPQDGYLIEYGFVEPPHFPSPEFPRGNPAFGNSSPSMHFRHFGRVNVVWADGHVTSEKFTWTTPTNIYGARNAAWSVGWFGPRTNYFFDSGDKAEYASNEDSK